MWNILRGKEIIFIGDLAANNRGVAEYFFNRGVFDPMPVLLNCSKSKSRISLKDTEESLKRAPSLSLALARYSDNIWSGISIG